jgi:hypothetical protein
MRATCPVHLTLLDLIILFRSYDIHRVWNVSMV